MSPATRTRLERIRTFCGVVPLAAFVVLHLAGNATAIVGRDAFEAHLGRFDRLAAHPILEVCGILLPLVLHAAIGVALLHGATSDSRAPGTPRDWGRLLRRASGLAVLVFVAVHLAHYRWPRWTGNLRLSDVFDRLVTDLQGMGRFAFYLAGASAVVFHLVAGLARVLSATRRAPVPPGRRRTIVVVCGLFGILLWVLSLEVLGQHYAGGSVAGSSGLLRHLGPFGESASP